MASARRSIRAPVSQAAYVYNAYGYLSELKDNATGTVYWKANARDAELHLLGQTAGNGVVTTQAFDPATGRVQTIRAGAANAVANFSYGFDTLGNLTSRGDANAALAETFGYDALNRLTGVTTNGTPRSATFDAEGDILTKSDVGTYSYGAGAGPHAVTSVAGTVNGVANPGFAYDANGNMTSGAGRTYAYTSFNMAISITAGAASAAFTYDANHNRVVQAATAGTTWYLNDAASGAMSELYNPGHVWRDYILADGRLVLVRTLTGTTASYQYLTTDHLGSVTVIADQAGAVLQRLSYDAWGARRNPDGTVPASPIVGQTTRGFTGQEAMDALGLINFNARLYDPQLARFLAADPTISNAYLDQLLDRYGYVGNNPLSLTDPTGLCFITCDPVFRAVIAFVVVFILEQPQFLPALEGTTLTAAGLTTSEVAALNAGILGGVAGLITTGNLKGALLSAGEAVAFSGVGDLLGVDKLTGPAQTAATFVAHGAVGGLFTVAGGGKFGSGFLAAGVGSLGDNAKLDNSNAAIGTAEHAILGGVGSVLGGGKFANGAITGAFGYLFNKWAHSYHYRGSACEFSDIACNKFSAFSALRHIDYPGQDPNTEVISGQVYYVFGDKVNGSITVTVDENTLTITNTTNIGHAFCCGTVKLSLIPTTSGIDLDILGTGMNTSFLRMIENYGASLVFPAVMAPSISTFIDESYRERTGSWPSRPTPVLPAAPF